MEIDNSQGHDMIVEYFSLISKHIASIRTRAKDIPKNELLQHVTALKSISSEFADLNDAFTGTYVHI